MGSIIGGAGYGGSVWNNPAYQKTAGASGSSGTSGTGDVSGTSGTSGAGDISGVGELSGLPLTEMCGLPDCQNSDEAKAKVLRELQSAANGATASATYMADSLITVTGTVENGYIVLVFEKQNGQIREETIPQALAAGEANSSSETKILSWDEQNKLKAEMMRLAHNIQKSLK